MYMKYDYRTSSNILRKKVNKKLLKYFHNVIPTSILFIHFLGSGLKAVGGINKQKLKKNHPSTG